MFYIHRLGVFGPLLILSSNEPQSTLVGRDGVETRNEAEHIRMRMEQFYRRLVRRAEKERSI